MLEAVPVAVVALRVEFIQGSQVTGVVTTPVALAAGGTVTVDNPDVPANALATLQVTSSRSSVAKGYSVALTAVGLFANGLRQDLTTVVAWTSSNSGIASITATGGIVQASANGVGTATLTASSSGISGNATLTVTEATLLSVAVTPSNPSLPAGFTQGLTVMGLFSDDSLLDVTARATWASSDSNVATVSAGTLQAVAPGTAVVTATVSGVSGTSRVQVDSATLTATHAATSKSGSTQFTVSGGVLPSGDFIGGVAIPVTGTNNSLDCVALGDFNGDGRLDIVTDDVSTRKLWVLLGNAAQGYAPPVSYSLSGTPRFVLVADVNGDSALDLAVACDDGVHVLLGNGDGTFLAGSVFGTGAYGVTLAELNSDGRPDLVVTEGTTISSWVSQGDGTFTFVQRVSETTTPTRAMPADFNEDGNLDLAYALPQYNRLIFRPGVGDGTFGVKQTTTTSVVAGTAWSTLADYNRDTHADVVVGNQLFLGQGNGTFAAPSTFRTTQPGYLVTADLNADGKADLVAVDTMTAVVSVHLGNGDGTFGTRTTTSGGYLANSLAVGDLNADGRPDVVVANSSGDLFLLPGNDTGIPEGVAVTPFGMNGQIRYTQAVDFNRDGLLDALVWDANVGKTGVVMGCGDGTFAAPTWLGAAPSYDTTNALAGDVNGDGACDVLTGPGGWHVPGSASPGHGRQGQRWKQLRPFPADCRGERGRLPGRHHVQPGR